MVLIYGTSETEQCCLLICAFAYCLYSFERLYDGMWARRAGHNHKAGSEAHSEECTQASADDRVDHWSNPAELAHLQRRVTDLAAELDVNHFFSLSRRMCIIDLQIS